MARRRNPDRVDEEEVCIACFATYVRDTLDIRDMTFERERHDPPDYWVELRQLRFATEVTSITDEDGLRFGDLCRRLASDIESEAKRRGRLRCGYMMTVHREPELPRPHSAEWRSVVNEAAEEEAERLIVGRIARHWVVVLAGWCSEDVVGYGGNTELDGKRPRGRLALVVVHRGVADGGRGIPLRLH